MSALGFYSLSSAFCHNLLCVPVQARVMDNGFSRMLLQEVSGQEPYHIITFNKFSVFIKEEAAVEIPIPGNSHVRLNFQYLLNDFLSVFRKHRIRYPIRKISIRLHQHFREMDRQMFL